MGEFARTRVRGFQVESRGRIPMQARRSRSAIGMMILLLAALIPLSVPSASAEIVCCGPNEFDLFLIGENNEATMTPFENELVGINEKGVSQSVQGVEEIASWSIVWKQSATMPESTWRFNIAYEVENAAGVYDNATVDVLIGNNLYTAESGTPGAFMSGSDVVGIDIEIPQVAIS